MRAVDKEHAISQFDVSLERTGAGYFDFYLLHNFGGPRSHFYDDFDLWDWVIEKKKEGKIKHIGLSTHGTAEELDGLLTAHPEMEFVQLQINYVDWDDPVNQAGACYRVAMKHNVPVIIMEPVKGGLLAKPPQAISDIFEEHEPESTPASWAVRYAADLDNVITVLSGMSNVEQMKDNLKTMKDFKGFNDEQRAVIERAQEEFKKIPIVPCTTCNYCAKVCPMEIGISGSFAAINELHQFDNLASAKNTANWLVGEQGFRPATECIKCGKCEEACPQKIEIVRELEKVVEVLLK